MNNVLGQLRDARHVCSARDKPVCPCFWYVYAIPELVHVDCLGYVIIAVKNKCTEYDATLPQAST